VTGSRATPTSTIVSPISRGRRTSSAATLATTARTARTKLVKFLGESCGFDEEDVEALIGDARADDSPGTSRRIRGYAVRRIRAVNIV